MRAAPSTQARVAAEFVRDVVNEIADQYRKDVQVGMERGPLPRPSPAAVTGDTTVLTSMPARMASLGRGAQEAIRATFQAQVDKAGTRLEELQRRVAEGAEAPSLAAPAVDVAAAPAPPAPPPPLTQASVVHVPAESGPQPQTRTRPFPAPALSRETADALVVSAGSAAERALGNVRVDSLGDVDVDVDDDIDVSATVDNADEVQRRKLERLADLLVLWAEQATAMTAYRLSRFLTPPALQEWEELSLMSRGRPPLPSFPSQLLLEVLTQFIERE